MTTGRGERNDEDIRVIQPHDAPPPELASVLPALHAAARDAGWLATIVISPSSHEAGRQLAKRRHDLKAALRTLGFTAKALESGYTFQDDKAAAKLEAINKALLVLGRDADLLARVLSPDQP